MTSDNKAESNSKNAKEGNVNLEQELHMLKENELAHLESEFENYRVLYPTTELPSGIH
jgi:hypothetical protein